jgi:hypothetical protein
MFFGPQKIDLMTTAEKGDFILNRRNVRRGTAVLKSCVLNRRGKGRRDRARVRATGLKIVYSELQFFQTGFVVKRTVIVLLTACFLLLLSRTVTKAAFLTTSTLLGIAGFVFWKEHRGSTNESVNFVLPEQQIVQEIQTLRRTLFLLALLGLIIAFALGTFHIITGAGVNTYRIVPKDAFGFSETFISADSVVGQPIGIAMINHPIAVKVLIREGLIREPRLDK